MFKAVVAGLLNVAVYVTALPSLTLTASVLKVTLDSEVSLSEVDCVVTLPNVTPVVVPNATATISLPSVMRSFAVFNVNVPVLVPAAMLIVPDKLANPVKSLVVMPVPLTV